MNENADFFDQVYQVVRLIPSGRVTSYGAIARYIGSPRAGRMVGFALNGSGTQHEFVPAHRVVNRVGMLSGKRFFGGPNTMQELLESEGITIKNDQVQNFSDVFWDPNMALKLD